MTILNNNTNPSSVNLYKNFPIKGEGNGDNNEDGKALKAMARFLVLLPQVVGLNRGLRLGFEWVVDCGNNLGFATMGCGFEFGLEAWV